MDVEKTPSPKNTPGSSSPAATFMETEISASPRVTKKAKETHTTSKTPSPSSAKKKGTSSPSILDPAKKLRRKMELVLKKTLVITLGSKQTDSACIPIDIGDDGNGPIGVQTIAEIMPTRVALPLSDLTTTMPPQKPLISYLAMAHRKASEEAKTLRQNASSAEKNAPTLAVLEEIMNQSVSYAASSLMEPDLFEQGADSRDQIFHAIVAQTGSTADPTCSITFGVTGLASSFYHQLCDELHAQDAAAFHTVITGLAAKMMEQLKKCDNLESSVNVNLGSNNNATTSSPLGLVSGLQAICSHKKAALAVTQLPEFLLPVKGSPTANEVVRPPLPQGADLLRMLAGSEKPYKKRSGVGLEKNTLLGLALRISIPKNNPAFSPTNILRQTLSSVEQTSNQQRQQLFVYQNALNQLIKTFIKAGPEARGQVMQWFNDCMLVNPGATAMRPDPTKVSSQAMLLNTSVVLLKLCEPFVLDETKHHLIDPGFVSSTKDNKGIFPTSGDEALPRLGENAAGSTVEYAPKNAFIPQCFFLTARSLALAIVPMLSQHENLLRHISHLHWQLRSSNGDFQSDPHFSILMARQRSNEVALFQEEMIVDTLRFCNLMAKVLYEMDDDSLRHMPEHFVDNICDMLTQIADLKPKVLRGMEFRHVFSMVVKLLGPKYANMVRNYNLRATLGDVLYELYLPPEEQDSRRRGEVPSSISCDPMKGGLPYLTSNQEAIATLAASLLLLYGEVEHTGYYDKMSHRAKIQSLIKYLWESKEHRASFQKITQSEESFITFANGIINETNHLIATVMQKLPTIKQDQDTMADATQWANMTEEDQSILSSRLSDNEREVKHALPLCNKTMQMLGYLNTNEDIRTLFLHQELCERLVNLLNHVLQKIIGGKGMELKVCSK
jgi:ubiquitin conjugation factor E4 B